MRGDSNPVVVIIPHSVVVHQECISEEPGLVLHLPNIDYTQGLADLVDVDLRRNLKVCSIESEVKSLILRDIASTIDISLVVQGVLIRAQNGCHERIVQTVRHIHNRGARVQGGY